MPKSKPKLMALASWRSALLTSPNGLPRMFEAVSACKSSPPLVRFDHCGFIGELGRDAEFNLRIIRLDKNVAGPCDEALSIVGRFEESVASSATCTTFARSRLRTGSSHNERRHQVHDP